jgi:hypothetical protein
VSGPVSGYLLGEQDAQLAWALIRHAALDLERRNGTAPTGAAALEAGLGRFARRTLFAQASAEGEPVNLDDDPDPAQSHQVGVTAAAALAGVSHQHIRRLCRRGDLIARKTPAGAWLIDASSAAALAARRERTDVAS